MLVTPEQSIKLVQLSLRWILEIAAIPAEVSSLMVAAEVTNASIATQLVKDSGEEFADMVMAVVASNEGCTEDQVIQIMKSWGLTPNLTEARIQNGLRMVAQILMTSKDQINELVVSELMYDPVRDAMRVTKDEVRRTQVQVIRKVQENRVQLFGKKRKRSSDKEGSTQGVKMEQIQKDQARVAVQLREIMARAGQEAKINVNDSGLPDDQFWVIQEAQLTIDAPTYAQGNINAWRKFEAFCGRMKDGTAPYPPTRSQVLAYAMAKVQEGCGPTVLPAIRTSIDWMSRKIQMETIDLSEDPLYKALENKVKQHTMKKVKEAPAWPIQVIILLEMCIFGPFGDAIKVFAGFVLVMIFASLRWNDTMRSRPDDLTLRQDCLTGHSWQTKTCKLGRHMAYAVVRAGFSQAGDWVATWYAIYMSHLERVHEDIRKRVDFLMPWVEDADHMDWSDSISYNKAIEMIKQLLDNLVDWVGTAMSEEDKKIVRSFAKMINGFHGCKATLVDLLAQRGEHYAAQMQGHFKTPTMVEK